MTQASISFAGYEFHLTGRPRYSSEAKYEADSVHAIPRRKVTIYTIEQWFLEDTFSDNETRYRTMLAALSSAPEGVLSIVDENGQELVNVRARVMGDLLPPQWGQTMKQVEVKFEAVEAVNGASPFDATFTPTGGDAVVLTAVAKFKEEVRAERYSLHVADRREARGVVMLSGVVQADPQLGASGRREFLLAEKARLQGAVDAKEGTLEYGEFSKVVRVEQFEADLEDGTDKLRWSLVADYLRFPAGNYAEAEYTVRTADSIERAERITSVSGRITAHDAAGAAAKRDALRATFAGSGRMLMRSELSPAGASGTDGTSETGGYDFSLEWREILPGAVVRFKLSVSDKTDAGTGMITSTYSGSVVASSSAAALAKARDLGAGIYPMPVSSTETVNSMGGGGTLSGSDEGTQFMECVFSYEYQRRGTERHAEVTVSNSREHFGNSAQTVSGFCVAATSSDALTWAREFRPSGVLILSEREDTSTTYHGVSGSLFQRVTFSYTAFTAAVNGTLDYGVRTAENFQTRETTVSYTGVCYSDSEANANTLINALVASLTGRKESAERTSSFKKDAAGTNYFHSRNFSITRSVPMAAGGDDILEAESTLETTYSVDHAVVTPIPFGTPHVQTGCGTTPGRKVATGSVVALNLGTAQAWARARMPSGGNQTEQDAPRESETTMFYPMSGESVRAYRVQFSYGKTFANLVAPV